MNEITQNYQCKTGDVIQLNYKLISVWEQAQINSVMEQINSDPRMTVVFSTVLPSTWYSDTLQIQIQVRENPFPLVILILAIAAISTSIFLYLSLDKIYLISTQAPQAVSGITSTISLGILAVIGIIVLVVMGKLHA